MSEMRWTIQDYGRDIPADNAAWLKMTALYDSQNNPIRKEDMVVGQVCTGEWKACIGRHEYTDTTWRRSPVDGRRIRSERHVDRLEVTRTA